MKKRGVVLVLLACLFCCLFLFGGCTAKANIDFGVRYYSEEQVSSGNDRAETTYIAFRKNGTGTYRHYYEDYNGKIQDYTITFKYTLADDEGEGVCCFYNSVVYGENHDHNKYGEDTLSLQGWSLTLSVSQDILMTKGGSLYVSEGYLREIPNFGNYDE